MRCIILIALVVLLIGLVDCQKFDCEKQLSTVTTPRILRKCLGKIPYNKAEGEKILDNFRNVFANSSLTPLFAASLEPYKINSDFLGEIEKIRAKAWKSYFEFHLALQRVVFNGRDVHINYFLPDGFYSFELIRPYQISVTQEGDRVVVRLLSCVEVCNTCTNEASQKLEAICTKIEKFLGREILTVNGVNALDYYLKAAEISSEHTDVGGRFNEMLNTFTNIPLNDFYKGKFKGKENFTFAGEKPNNVQVRIIGNNFEGRTLEDIPATLTAFADSTQATINEWFGGAASTSRRTLKKHDFRLCERPTRNRPALPGQVANGQWKKTNRAVRAVTNKCEKKLELPIGSDTAVLYHCNYKTTTEKVQLLTLPTFSDSDENPGYEVFLAVVNDAIESGITKFMVDVTGNGGGNGCLAYCGVAALTGESPTKILQFYTARKTPGMRYIYRDLFGDTNAVAFDKNGDPVVLREFWDNSVDVKYSFAPADTFLEPFFFCNSPQFTTGQQLYDSTYLTSEYTPATMPESPLKEIIALTNGECYSACSIFLTNLNQLQVSGSSRVQIKNINYGGEPGKPFDGSNVATNILSGTPTITFRPALINTNLDGTTGDVRQFSRIASDDRLNIWTTPDNKEEIWSLGIDKFGFSS